MKYGEISPKTDPRYFIRDMVEELLDALNYAEWSYEKGEIFCGRYMRIERDVKGLIELLLPCQRARTRDLSRAEGKDKDPGGIEPPGASCE